MTKFLRTLPMKLWAALCALILFTFFSNDFGLTDLQKTAIVLAAGIDRGEDGFALTAQVAVPKGSDRTTGGTSSVELTGSGETIADCLADLYGKTGWVPKLVFCDLILLGEGALREDVFDCLDYFLRNEYIPDSCYLAACEGSAREMLSSQSAVDDTSSLALSKLFSRAAERSGQVMTATLRQFAIGYFGASRSGYMPYVRAQAQEGAQSAAQGASQGGAQGKEGAGGQDGQKTYSARQTALFSGGKMTGLLGEEETFAFSLLEGNVYAGSIPCGGKTYLILKNEGETRLTEDGAGAPGLSLSVSCKVQVCSESDAVPPAALAKGELSKEEEEALSALLTGQLRSLWDKCAQAECDLLFFRRSLARASRAAYAEWKDVPLASLPVRAEARAQSLR